MKFSWQIQDDVWHLTPSMISVRKLDGFWRIYVGDRQMQLPYTSEQGAKLDAWQFAKSKCKALFGAYRVQLAA